MRHAALVAAIAFLLPALATLHDVGLTWDEGESYRAGARNLRIVAAALRGEPLPSWPWHELPGYQFAADALRAAFAGVANRLLWEPGSYHGFHLFNLLVTATAVCLTGRLAARESGTPVLAPLAALLLALQPKLVAHAVSNPKDGLGVLAWLLAMSALAAVARAGTWRRYALLGLATGVALATHVSAALLVPLVVVWVLAAGDGSRGRRLGGLAVAGAQAAATTLLLWPWLWPSPLGRGLHLVRYLGAFDVDMRVLYLGRLFSPGELPWHYGAVSLLVATPLPWLLLALAGALRALLPAGGGVARLARLAGLWLLLVLAADAAAPARYDGARHLLPALPALALLAGSGAAVVAGWRPARGQRAWQSTVAAVGATAALAIGWQLAAIHPYADAWLNLEARRALGPEAQRQLELEYWGGSYREGARWLLANAPEDSLVLVPIGPHAAAPYLADRLELVPHDAHRETEHPQYLMLMTREAWFTSRLRRVVADRAPVFTVRRQGSTLLAIYRLR